MFVSYFFGNFKMKVVIIQSLFEISHTVVGNTKATISTTFPMLIAYFFTYFKMEVMVFYCVFDIT